MSDYDDGYTDYENGNYNPNNLVGNAEQNYYRGWQTRHQEYVELRRTKLFAPPTSKNAGFIDYLSGHDRRIIFPFEKPEDDLDYQAGRDEAERKIKYIETQTSL